MFHNVCFIPGPRNNLTVVRTHGSAAPAAADDADVVLQQQLRQLFSHKTLRSSYKVQVYTAKQAESGPRHYQDSIHSRKNNSSVGDAAIDMLAFALWTGDVQHDGTRAEKGAVRLTRAPVKDGSVQLLWEDKLTVISQPGMRQVRG
jgi:hypothetical protein